MNPTTQAGPALYAEDGFVDSSADPGARLFVRARGRSGGGTTTPIVLVHGFFQPASAILDVPGCSLHLSLASSGRRVYLFDMRGYGRSTRPAFMSQPAHLSRPGLACMDDALADLDDVVRHVCEQESVARVDLVGYSWGTARGANFAIRWPQRVRRLALYAPVWCPRTGVAGQAEDPDHPGQMSKAWGGYRVLGPGELRRQWNWEIDDADPKAFRSPELPATAEAALFESDPVQGGAGYRAPLGALCDALRVARGEALFDAAAIQHPVLLVRGRNDRLSSAEDAEGLHRALGPHAWPLVTVSPGTHLLHLEHQRDTLLQELLAFLASDGD